MVSTFKNSLDFNSFRPAREWRNGRRAGLRIQCRKAWGFKSPLSHHTLKRSAFSATTGSLIVHGEKLALLALQYVIIISLNVASCLATRHIGALCCKI